MYKILITTIAFNPYGISVDTKIADFGNAKNAADLAIEKINSRPSNGYSICTQTAIALY